MFLKLKKVLYRIFFFHWLPICNFNLNQQWTLPISEQDKSISQGRVKNIKGILRNTILTRDLGVLWNFSANTCTLAYSSTDVLIYLCNLEPFIVEQWQHSLVYGNMYLCMLKLNKAWISMKCSEIIVNCSYNWR